MRLKGKANVCARRAALAAAAFILLSASAFAQKPGGVLRIPHGDSPASMSIHEESTIASEGPMMAVFNNLVMFDQHAPQNRLDTIVPDLADEWSWSEDGTTLTFKLRRGVKWHDGKPFTANDVECTWDMLLGKGAEKLRINPRKSWYQNLAEVTTNGDFEVGFHLKRAQPAFIGLLASGWSPVNPCHVTPREMRQHPIGTGPFKFVEFKPNEFDQADPQPRLLEAGPALSRWHRVHDHSQRLDLDPGPRRPPVRSYRTGLRADIALEGDQEPSAGDELRNRELEYQPYCDHQPRGAAV